MNLHLKAAIKGRYRLQVKKNGAVKKDTGWFANLITNGGLDNMGTLDNWPAYASVGTSSATPQFTDTQLGSRVATVRSQSSTVGAYDNFRIDVENRYAVFRWTYTFPSGAAAGNLAEVGVGPLSSGLNISSRARILDSGGNPTTITVLPDEDLVLVWELFVKQPVIDYSNDLGGRTVTTRASRVDANTGNGAWNSNGSFASFSRTTARAFSGAISGITGEPTGSLAQSGTSSLAAYVPGSHSRSSAMTWPTSSAINGTAVRSIQWNFGPTAWQSEFDPPIPAKDNTQTLRINVTISWGRDSGPA